MSACSGSSIIAQHINTQEIPAPQYTYKVVSADFNNDGRQDIAVISKNGMLRVFLNGDKGFENPLELQADPYSISLAATDLDGDGNMDIAVLTEGSVGPFYLGDSRGGFSRHDSQLSAPGRGRYIEAADLNNDGLADLVAVGTGFAALYINNGNLSFDYISFFMGGEFSGRYITACDLDGNGFRDIIFSDYPYGKLYVIWNNGDKVFSPPELIFEAKGQTISAAVPISLNGEHLPGLCITLESSGTIVILKNTGNRKFQEMERISILPLPYHLTMADMNMDGIDDIVITHVARYSMGTGGITILFGPFPNPNPSMVSLPTTAGFPMAATAVDWDMDGYNDLFLPNYDAHTVTFIPSPGKGH